jgi:hypothetical protein
VTASKIDELVAGLASVRDDQTPGPSTPGAGALLTAITAEKRAPVAAQRRSRRRWAVILPVAAVATAAAVVAIATDTGPSPAHHAGVQLAALSFSTEAKYLVVKVMDPFADPARYRKEFAAHGLNVDLKMVPASPSIVGTFVGGAIDDRIKVITAKGRCDTGGGRSCPVEVKIPVNYTGHAMLAFGRPARTGENYNTTAPVTAPGEMLHGVDLTHRTVTQLRALLAKRHITIAEYHWEDDPNAKHDAFGGVQVRTLRADQVPGSWHIVDVAPLSENSVIVTVDPKQWHR